MEGEGGGREGQGRSMTMASSYIVTLAFVIFLGFKPLAQRLPLAGKRGLAPGRSASSSRLHQLGPGKAWGTASRSR